MTKAINIRLDVTIIQAVKSAAAADNRSAANWIKLAIIKALPQDGLLRMAEQKRHATRPKAPTPAVNHDEEELL